MTPSFNLISEPFIRCLLPDGSVMAYGLLDVLLKAHTIIALGEESPLIQATLHRLLLAILHRCYNGPRKPADRVILYQAGQFDAVRLVRYFEKWTHRFDLFDEKYPFYQQGGFATRKPSGINRLGQELARGNNALLFDHTTDDPPPVFSPARAARLVIAEQGFAVGGGKSDTGNTTHAPLVSGAMVLVRGATLFETLWLNLTVFSDKDPIASLPADIPVWEREPKPPHKENTRPQGYLDYLTWQSRTIKLHPETIEGKVVVRMVSYAQGRKFKTEQAFFDPMVAYFQNPDSEEAFQPVRFNENRDVWRDSAVLFQVSANDEKSDRGPKCLAPKCLQSLTRSELKPILPPSARYRLSILGLCTDQAKVTFWRHDSLPLPLAYLDRAELLVQLKLALALAEAVAVSALQPAAQDAVSAWMKTDPDMKPDTKRVSKIVDSFAPQRLYWSRLEQPFQMFLTDLAVDGADTRACVIAWFFDTLVPAVTNAFEQSIGRMDGGRDLKAISAGRKTLMVRLKQIRNAKKIPDREKEGVS